MYKYFMLFFLLCRVAAAQQAYPGRFTIEGDVSGINGAERVTISYPDATGKTLTDTAPVINGRFHLQGMAEEPALASLHLQVSGQELPRGIVDRKNTYRVLLEPATYSITATDNFSNAQVQGSRLQEEYLSYYKPLYALYLTMQPYNMKAQALERAQDMEALAMVQQTLDSLNKIESDRVDQYVTAHPQSPVALFAVSEYNKPTLTPKPFKVYYDKLAPALQQTWMGKQLAKKIAEMAAFSPGTMAADFIQPDTSGQLIHLSDFKGRYVFVDFWASWCGPCRAQSPFVKRTFDLFGNKQFAILSVSLDESREKWLNAIHEDQVALWTHVGDMKGRLNAAAALYQVHSIPQNLLIDPNGMIIGKNLHGLQLENKLKQLLQ